MFFFQLKLYLIHISLFILTNVHISSCEQCNMSVSALLYDSYEKEFTDRFSLLNQYGQRFKIKIKGSEKNNPSLDLISMDNNDVWIKNLFYSSKKRGALTVFSEAQDNYHALVRRPKMGDFEKSSLISIKIAHGTEDRDYGFDGPLSALTLFSTIYIFGMISFQFSYIALEPNKGDGKVRLEQKTIDTNQGFTVDFLYDMGGILNQLNSLPTYMIHSKDDYSETFVIRQDATYTFGSLEQSLNLHLGSQEIKSDRKIKSVKGLICQRNVNPSKDKFYILDENYDIWLVKPYSQHYTNLSDYSLSIEKAVNHDFSIVVSALKMRKPDAAYVIADDHYYALEKEHDHTEKKPHYKLNRYQFYFGSENTDQSSSIDENHPYSFHSVIVKKPDVTNSYSYYFHRKGSEIVFSYHKNQDDIYNYKEIGNYKSFHPEFDKRLPLYIVPAVSGKSQLALVIYSDFTYSFISINDGLALIYPSKPVLRLMYDCNTKQQKFYYETREGIIMPGEYVEKVTNTSTRLLFNLLSFYFAFVFQFFINFTCLLR